MNQLFDKFINNIDLENFLWQITSDQYEWQACTMYKPATWVSKNIDYGPIRTRESLSRNWHFNILSRKIRLSRTLREKNRKKTKNAANFFHPENIYSYIHSFTSTPQSGPWWTTMLEMFTLQWNPFTESTIQISRLCINIFCG